jgi:MoxR-like ATPase
MVGMVGGTESMAATGPTAGREGPNVTGLAPDSAGLADLARTAERVRESVGRVIVGKTEVVELLLVALLCDGHVLLEDVPGVGKTMLARSLAASLGLRFARIQCTPDLLPADIIGTSVYNPNTREFEFRPGPVMNQIVLADEINRATPRTQSALLEAMGERQVTVDGVTRRLEEPFIVLATQNPIEFEGTFPLPEAQLDRFLMRVHMGYPDAGEEREIVVRQVQGAHPSVLTPVAGPEDIQRAKRAVRTVHVDPDLLRYLIDLVAATRQHPDVLLGASPRASISLFMASQALAAVRGRDYVLPDDVQYLAPYVLTHRMQLKPESQLRGRTAADVVQEVIERRPLPIEEGVSS